MEKSQKYKQKRIFFLMSIIVVAFIVLVSAAEFTPQGNINLHDVYGIFDATNISTTNLTAVNISSTYFYGNGSGITDVVSGFANRSTFWGDYELPSHLNNLILSKWLNITDRPTFVSNFTNDLNFLNQTTADPFYVNIDGDTWEGDMSAGDYNLTDIKSLVFNTTGCDDAAEGTVCWNEEDQTLNVVTGLGNIIQVGQEQWALSKNGDSQILSNGQVVTLVGSSGDRGLVARADASNISLASRLAVITIDTCPVSGDCAVNTFGRIRDLDTSAWAAGTLLYLSADGSGNLTDTVPEFPNFRVLVAFVVRSHATDGIIFVQPQLDYTDGITLGDLYVRNDATVANNLLVSNNLSVVGSIIQNGYRFLNLSSNALIDGDVFSLLTTGPSAVELPHLYVQPGGSGQFSGMVRSWGIVDENVSFLNNTGRTDCQTYFNSIGEELKIDCNTTTTGADFFVSDDFQVVGDVWLKNNQDQWRFMSRTLDLQDRLFSNLVLNELNSSLVGTNFSITESRGESLIINIDTNETITEKLMDWVAITEGTNTTPVKNYVYYSDKANPTLTSAINLPTVDNAAVAQMISGSGYTYASVIDEQSEEKAIRRIFDRFYNQGPLYLSGYSQEANPTNINFTGGSMNVITHEDISTNVLDTDDAYFYIEDGTDYVQLTGLDAIDEYSDGTPIANNKYFNVVFGVIHNDLEGQENRMIAIIQRGTTEYITLSGAELDSNQLSNYYTGDSLLNKLYIPVARVVMQRTGSAVNTIQTLSTGSTFIDLRGITSSAGAAAAAPSIYTASGTLLDLTGTVFSVNEGTLTDDKFCKYESGTGIVCTSEGSAVESDPWWSSNYTAYNDSWSQDTTYTAGTNMTLTGTTFSWNGTWAESVFLKAVDLIGYVTWTDLWTQVYNKTQIDALLAPKVDWTTLWTQVYNETEVDAINQSMENRVTSGLAAQDACSEITGCIENALTDLVQDTSPQLGGYLDTDGQNIGSTADEIENIYVATNSRIYFGDGQETNIYYNGTSLIING